MPPHLTLLSESAAQPAQAGVISFALIGLYVFILACFAGFQLIKKVPPTLHTPLMSGANAISGITILGAMAVAQISDDAPFAFSTVLGVFAVALATINVVGGFMVTGRMLKMFGKKKA